MPMTVRTRQPRLRTPVLRARLGRGAVRPATAATDAPAAPPQTRERDAGGPEDRALYRCQCGYVFEATVSTSVGCPHCGDAQAW